MKKIITILCVFLINFSFSQSVKEDNTFGNNGIYKFTNRITSDFSGSNSIIQSDGKVIVAGPRINESNISETFVLRLNSNGTLDTSFANNGFFTAFKLLDSTPQLFLNGTDIFVFYEAEKTLIKLNSDGMLDTNFGTNGIYIFSPFQFLSSNKAVLIGNNFYVGLGGGFNINNARLINFDISTGSILFTSDISSIQDIDDIYKGPNGKILLRSKDYRTYEIYLTLVNTDGTIDTSFGTNGILKVASFPTIKDFNGFYQDYVTIDDSNNIIYGIHNYDTSATIVKKYTLSGNLDTSFATNGIYQQNNSYVEGITTFANQIYLYGAEKNGSTLDSSVVTRLNSNGSLDTSFDNDGTFIFNGSPNQEIAESFNVISTSSFLIQGKMEGTSVNNVVTYVAKFNVSPNLSTDKFESENKFFIENPLETKINFFTAEKNAKIEIYSTEGKLIKVVYENNSDVSSFPKGVYFAKTYLPNGKIVTQKLIKN